VRVKDLYQPVAPARADQALRELDAVLAGLGTTDVPAVVDDASDAIHLPRSIVMILREILANFAAGIPVSVVPTYAELTTQQAADLLNVSRPYLVKLLDEGDLAYRMVGTHRRIRMDDLQEYRHKQTLASKRAADDLTELSQDLDLY
jgi:excisionase family DNA binding protein